jgi:hypothetical protein
MQLLFAPSSGYHLAVETRACVGRIYAGPRNVPRWPIGNCSCVCYIYSSTRAKGVARRRTECA